MTSATFLVGTRTEIIVASVIVPVTAATYATGRTLGDLIVLANLPDVNGDELVLIGAALADAAKQSLAADLVLFDQNPAGSTFTNNVAADIVAADLPKIVDVVNLATASYAAFAATSVVAARNVRIPIVTPASRTLYAALVSRGAPTYTANCLTLKLSFSKRAV